MTPHPTLHDGTHVLFDAFTAEHFLEMGAANVVRASDSLLLGPGRLDTAEHARARRAWWYATPDEPSEEWDKLYSPTVRWQRPVVLWGSANIHAKANLWRTCHWLRHLGIPLEDVLIIQLEPAPRRVPCTEPEPRFHGSEYVGAHPDEVLLERLAHARPWPAARYDAAVRLWEVYVDPDLRRFAEVCAEGVDGFPELAAIWKFFASFFPRQSTDGSLRLSRFDELLFTILSDEPKTAVKLYIDRSPAGEELIPLFCCTGDLFLLQRLQQWADHAAGAFVARAPGPQPGNPMNDFVYRITERGARLRDEGLATLTDAPILPMAGAAAYAPSSPFVVREGGALARL